MVLTPAHFAVQRSLKTPVPTFVSRSHIPIGKKWLLIQEIQQQFWNRFMKEYLSTQQKRYKWLLPQRNLKIDDVVVIKDHLSHPLDWPLGRIVKCYPDEKGIVRKVDLKSKNNSMVHRAVNKLIPIPSEEEEIQINKNRKHTRRMSPCSLINMFTMTLLCLSFVFTPTKSISIEELPSGLSIRLLQENVGVKLLDVKFILKTNINITEDFQQMDAELTRFEKYCDSLYDVAFLNITSQCNERYNTLLQELKLSKTNILGTYGSDRKRRGLFTKFAVGPILKKAAPYGVMTAAIGWQEYENWKHKKELHNVESKFNKASFILLNLTETEHAEVHKQLDHLVEQQKHLILEAELNSYVAEIQTLIASMVARHESFSELRPLEELNKFVDQLNSPTQIVRIPTLPVSEHIFSLHPIKKFLEDEIVHIEYNIPLVNLEQFLKYVIISSFNVSNQTIILDNNKTVQVIVANSDNSTYFFPEDVEEITPTLFGNVQLQKSRPVLQCY